MSLCAGFGLAGVCLFSALTHSNSKIKRKIQIQNSNAKFKFKIQIQNVKPTCKVKPKEIIKILTLLHGLFVADVEYRCARTRGHTLRVLLVHGLEAGWQTCCSGGRFDVERKIKSERCGE